MIMTPSIFCGDLSFFCTDADLCQLFQAVGPVRSAIVRRSRNNETLHYGFVHMETSEDAHRAIQSLNGQKFLGRRLRLNLGSSSMNNVLREGSFQMHVSFISHNVRIKINEEQLDRIFSQFGTVKDCIVKQYALTSEPPKQCGYGFVFFEDEASVDRAVRQSNLSLIENIHFDCKMSHHTAHKEPRPPPSGSVSDSPSSTAGSSASEGHDKATKEISPSVSPNSSFHLTQSYARYVSQVSVPSPPILTPPTYPSVPVHQGSNYLHTRSTSCNSMNSASSQQSHSPPVPSVYPVASSFHVAYTHNPVLPTGNAPGRGPSPQPMIVSGPMYAPPPYVMSGPYRLPGTANSSSGSTPVSGTPTPPSMIAMYTAPPSNVANASPSTGTMSPMPPPMMYMSPVGTQSSSPTYSPLSQSQPPQQHYSSHYAPPPTVMMGLPPSANLPPQHNARFESAPLPMQPPMYIFDPVLNSYVASYEYPFGVASAGTAPSYYPVDPRFHQPSPSLGPVSYAEQGHGSSPPMKGGPLPPRRAS